MGKYFPGNLETFTIGRLFVLHIVDLVEHPYNARTRYLCLCACGGYSIVTRSTLTNWKTKSCGCEQKKDRVRYGEAWTKHYRRRKLKTFLRCKHINGFVK